MKRTVFIRSLIPAFLLGGFTLTSTFAGCKEKDMSMKMNEPRNIRGVSNFGRTFGDLNQKQLNIAQTIGIEPIASREDAENLYRFGINIGLAFQLQDDLLDVYGDTKTFGKNIGGDILCNKKTFLLINALRRAEGEQKAQLEHWIARKDFDAAEKIAAVTNIYNVLGLKELSEAKMQTYYAEGMKNLAALSVSEERLAVLKEVTSRLMFRQS